MLPQTEIEYKEVNSRTCDAMEIGSHVRNDIVRVSGLWQKPFQAWRMPSDSVVLYDEGC